MPIWRSRGKKDLAAAVVQLDGSVSIWHMIDTRLVFNGLRPVVYMGYVKENGNRP
jgi:hypothetical protein